MSHENGWINPKTKGFAVPLYTEKISLTALVE